MDKIAGHLEVGVNDKGEVVVNHPDLKPDADGVGHIVFSPGQAQAFANMLNRKAVEAVLDCGDNALCGGCLRCIKAQLELAKDQRDLGERVFSEQRAALANAVEALKTVRYHLMGSSVAVVDAVFSNLVSNAAHDEWKKMQTVVDAARVVAKEAMPGGGGRELRAALEDLDHRRLSK